MTCTACRTSDHPRILVVSTVGDMALCRKWDARTEVES